MSEGSLQMLNMSEADLAAWYFVNYPSYFSDAECREHVEYEILSVWDRDCDEENWSEEERAELPPAISPYWLFRVECCRASNETDSLPAPRRKAYIKASIARIWDYRTKNLDAIAARRMPPFPKPLPLSFQTHLSSGSSRARGK